MVASEAWGVFVRELVTMVEDDAQGFSIQMGAVLAALAAQGAPGLSVELATQASRKLRELGDWNF